MESSQRDLFIDMVVDMIILNNNLITLSPCFIFITGVGLPKAGASFNCVIEDCISTTGKNPTDCELSVFLESSITLHGVLRSDSMTTCNRRTIRAAVAARGSANDSFKGLPIRSKKSETIRSALITTVSVNYKQSIDHGGRCLQNFGKGKSNQQISLGKVFNLFTSLRFLQCALNES